MQQAIRGVHKPAWRSASGNPVLFVVGSDGRERWQRELEAGEDEETVVAALYDLLDDLDPQPAGAS